MDEDTLEPLAELPQLKGKAAKAAKAERLRQHQRVFAASLIPATTPEKLQTLTDIANTDQRVKAEAKPSALEMVGAAIAGNTSNVIYDALFRERFEPVAGYKPMMKELPPDADTDLVERVAGSTSPEETAGYVSEFQDEQMRVNAVMSRGVLPGMVLQFGAEIADVTSWVAPFAVAKGLAKIGKGSDVLFDAGKTAQGYTSAVTENILSGTAIEAFKQTVQGEFKPVDLGVSMVADSLIGVGTGWLSARNAANKLLDSAADYAATRELDLITRAEQELGKDAPVEALTAKVAELRKGDINSIIADSVADSNKIIEPTPEQANGPEAVKLYHGTREDFAQPDYSLGGGLVHYAETPDIANRYALAAGGGRKALKEEDTLVFAPDGFVYEYDSATGAWFSVGKADQQKLPFPSAVLPIGKQELGDYDGMSTAVVDANREEPGWQRVAKNARIIERAYPGNVLDATTPEGLKVLAGMSDNGLAIPRAIIDSAKDGTFKYKFWSITKQAQSPHINKGVAHVVSQLEAAGYKGIRFNDDSHTTVALFQTADNANAPGNSEAGTNLRSTAKVKESLEAALTSPALMNDISPDSRGARQLINHLLKTLPADVLGNDVNFIGRGKRGSYNFVTNTIESPGSGGKDLIPEGVFPNEAVILAHEVVHAATSKTIAAVEAGAGGVTKDMVKAVQNLGAIRRDLELELKRLGKLNKESNFGANYATKNLHEFVAQVMSDNDTRQVLASMPAKGFVNMLTAFADAVMRLLGFNTKNKSALQEAVTLIDKVIQEGAPVEQRATITRVNGPAPAQVVDEIQQDPDAVRFGLNLASVGTPAERAQVQAMLALHKKAEAWEKQNPLDDAWNKRAENLSDTFGVASIGLTMLKSPSPLVRMLATELLEDASGVAGKRRNTAAISKHILNNMMLGNVLNDVQGAYNVWKAGKPGAGLKDDLFTGNMWDQWNKEIAKEIEARAQAGQPVNPDPNLTAAVNSIEAAYQRMADAQRKVNTLGSEGLPKTSVGYMPHKMNPQAVMNLTNAQRQTLHSVLVDQFVSIEGWDITFSDRLASTYMQRVRDRAAGDYGSAMSGHSMAEIVRESLVAMKLPDDIIEQHMDKFAKGALGHTKARIKLDLNRVYSTPDGDFKLMDVFETDQLELLRSHAGRVSGDVALTKHGVRGKPALDLIRRAMQYGEDGKRIGPDDKAFEAFDQMVAEFRNEPFGNATGRWMDRAMQANSLVRLGGVIWNQLAETLNGIAHVGVIRTFESLTSLPRLRSEIIALSKGEKVDNPILDSIELAGGAEFGTDAYKFVMPFDSPNHAYPSYGQDTLTVADRLLRGAGYLQGKLSGWRALHSAQQRGMAEQITHKMLRYIREGKDDVALQQFGVTDEMRNYMRANLDTFAKFDGNGRLINLDITKIEDADMRESIVQTVHRGTQQIIQGTFIGERGKWAHDGLMKLMTQFRTFSITSMEKQWGRQRNSRGAYAAFGLLLGTMTLSIPIYMARTYAASVGRPDQEEFLEERLAPDVIARATLNYAASSGIIGDVMDLLSATLPESLGVTQTGGRSGQESDFVGNYIAPASSLVNDIWKYAQSPMEVDDAAKLMPFRNIPYLVPLFNQAREE